MVQCSPAIYFSFFALIQTLMLHLQTLQHTLELTVDIKPITLDTAL